MDRVRPPSRNLAGRLSLLDRLKEDLRSAMRNGDQVRVKTIRTLISSIDNAGAVPMEPGPYEVKVGLDHDVERSIVTEDRMRSLVIAERDEYLRAAAEYRGLGLDSEAAGLETQAEIAAGYL